MVRSVEVYSLTQKERRRLSGTELQFSYRRNHFLQPGDIVVSTRWEYEPAAPEWVKQKIQEILDRRKRTQPIEYPSCGSVFKNPKNPRYHHSWQVIEALGLRGHRIGAAQFSEKHPNFIVNHGGAKASDVKALIELAKQRASQELGVKLEEEVQVVG